MSEEHSEDPRLLWLLDRIDKRCEQAVASLLREITEHLAIATSDAVTVRVLSPDQQSLLPLAAHHPNPLIAAGLGSVMGETTQPANTGLWRRVIAEAKPHRWHLPPGHVPDEASKEQAAFLRSYPIRALLAAPILIGERAVGGLSVMRFSVDKEFDERDEDLVVACATRVAHALDFRERVHASPA